MGVTRTVISNGDGQNKPKKEDTVTIEYTGYLYDPNKEDNEYRGAEFDSSKKRGDFETIIGVGKVIRGWEEAVPEMSLGEKSTLTITGDYAYGDGGFPSLIPPGATLIFDVHLKGINEKRSSSNPKMMGKTYALKLVQLPKIHVPLIVKLIIRDETTKEIDYSKFKPSEYTLTANATTTKEVSLQDAQLYFVFSQSEIDSSSCLALSLKTPDSELPYTWTFERKSSS